VKRSALLAGLSGSALAGCGVARSAARIAETAHGCVDVDVPAAGNMRVMRGLVPTRHVAVPVHFVLVAPPSTQAVDAVAYVLPGRGSSAADAQLIGLDGFLGAYLRTGGRPFALAFLDAGESYFHPRVSGEDRLAVATMDLPAVVRKALSVRKLREALMGQSMGGYGALLAAEREPQRFRAVAVAGPAIFPSYDDERHSVGDAFDSAADYARYDVIAHAHALLGRPVRIWCGRRDPFLPGVRAFARACPTADLHVEPGCHDEGFWRASAASLLSFIGSHLSA
jgi:pimeloyl-ACP methyl ester carboxylesterase